MGANHICPHNYIKYKVHKKIFEEMIDADGALYFEHSASFRVAREIVNKV